MTPSNDPQVTTKLLTVRVPEALKISFDFACSRAGTNSSEEIRRFMMDYVTKAAVAAYAAQVRREAEQ